MPVTKSQALCPVCGKVVGAWHKSGVHPKCEKKTLSAKADFEAQLRKINAALATPEPELRKMAAAINGLGQQNRDAILRRINSEPRPRR